MFDFYFLVGMVVLGVVLALITQQYEPDLFTCDGGSFWSKMLMNPLLIMVIGWLGGCVVRYYCVVDGNDHYVVTTPKSCFKAPCTQTMPTLLTLVGLPGQLHAKDSALRRLPRPHDC